MPRFLLFVSIALLYLVGTSLSASADDTLKPFADRDWIAVSTTAMGITGDIRITGDMITFDGRTSLRLRYIGDIRQEPEGPPAGQAAALRLYEFIDPHPVELRRGNHFCSSPGDQPVIPARYIALTVTRIYGPESLEMAIFSDKPKTMDGSDGRLCGTFGYISK